ncbi:MAG: hypothetical protein RSE47_07720 [Acidaminococcaceae bacterium]
MTAFLAGVLSLFNNTFIAILSQPILAFFFGAMLLAIGVVFFGLLCRAAKKM